MTNFSANGIACCYAQFKVPLSIELNVTVYPEFAKGSLTATFRTYMNNKQNGTQIEWIIKIYHDFICIHPYNHYHLHSIHILPKSF